MTTLFKTIVIALSIGSAISLCSFTKPSISHRIKSDFSTSSDTLFFDHVVYAYDSEGRVISTISYDYSFTHGQLPKIESSTTYYTTYIHDSVMEGELNKLKFKYKLNAQGYTASNEDGNIHTYDANDYLVKAQTSSETYDSTGTVIKKVKNTGVFIYTIANGDVVASNYMTYDSSEYATSIYTYYTEEDTRDFGKDVANGRRSIHLLKSRHERAVAGDTFTVNYTYLYDTSHRIVTQIGKSRSRSIIHNYTYFD
jgi:hypothetical protein